MDERLQRTVRGVASWEELKQLEANAKASNRLTEELAAALRGRSTELAISYIEQRTGLSLAELGQAERKIVGAVGEYVGLMREQGKYPGRTLEQLRNRKLIGAAEAAVARSRPSRGYETLVDANLEDLSYERIVVDHPADFSPRALWFSRKTLGIANRWIEAPAQADGKTQRHTERIVAWLAERATRGGGLIRPFTNAEVAEALGFAKPSKSGRAAGNIQSRIDFACYELGLPPLGLAATAPYDAAWRDEGRVWLYPVAAMAAAAREHRWTPEDFRRVAAVTGTLPAKSKIAWDAEMVAAEARLKAWAERFGSTELVGARVAPAEKEIENDDWIRDELILALDLYLRYRPSLPSKASPEILGLSALLVRLGEILGAQGNSTYRNPNGVYMKTMNFRRLDPEYIATGKVGLGRGNKQEEAVWNEFASNPARLREVAAAIRASIESKQVASGAWTDEEEEQTGTEGRVLTRMHRSRERDQNLAKRKKEKVLKDTGKLACEACDADAAEKYGDFGSGVIDAHHIRPLHTLTQPTKNNLADLALLCATCHRVIHAAKPWLTVPELRGIIENLRRRNEQTS